VGAAAAVFLAVLAVYLFTICPTVIDQYPLWTLLARACDFLPVGHTSAYRVALLSAVSGAAAAALLAWLVASLTGLALPGALAGIAFALWLPTWSQAVRPEVYALEALLFAVFLIALWRWHDERSPRRLLWVALSAGGVAMHHRTGFLAAGPALIAAFWLTRPRRLRGLLSAGALFITPFLCYLYLPIRAAARPPMNWGYPATAERFLYHVLGRQYARWAFANPLDRGGARRSRLALRAPRRSRPAIHTLGHGEGVSRQAGGGAPAHRRRGPARPVGGGMGRHQRPEGLAHPPGIGARHVRGRG